MPQLDDMTIDELIEEFEFLGEWGDQCEYLIELGRELPDLPEEQKVESNLVRGCQSRVWFVPRVEHKNGASTIGIQAKSDAMIVDGLIVVLLTLYNGKTPAEILSTDSREVFTRLGLETQLVPQRRNGLYSMVRRIEDIARLHSDAETDTSAGVTYAATLSVSDDREKRGNIERLDAYRIKRDFPALQQSITDDVPVTYLDTASSAQKPQIVIDKEREVYEQYYANGGHRGVYRFADRIDQALEESRGKLQRFVGAEHSSEIVFTSGTTMGINLVAQAWGRKFLTAGDEILINELEHHANFVPWQWIARQTGATIRHIPLADDGQLDLSRLDDVLGARTRMVAVTGMSNVLGTVPPVSEIARRARQVGALVLVDGAQSVPHMPLSIVKEQVDFLAFSGHKLYGPSGVGCLYGRRELLEEMDPFLCGGHMIDRVTKDDFTTNVLPAKFEAGTLPIAQAIALGTAVDYVTEHGLCHIHTHEQTLLRYATQRLQEVPGLRIYGPPDGPQRGHRQLHDRRGFRAGPGPAPRFEGDLCPTRPSLHDAAARLARRPRNCPRQLRLLQHNRRRGHAGGRDSVRSGEAAD